MSHAVLPPDESTHWSCRKLARAVGVSEATMQRVWTQAQRKTYRVSRYMASDDPELECKAADIMRLRLNPQQYAAALWVNEKNDRTLLFREKVPRLLAVNIKNKLACGR